MREEEERTMRIATVRSNEGPRPAVVVGDRVRILGEAGALVAGGPLDVPALIAMGESGLDILQRTADGATDAPLAEDDLLAPVYGLRRNVFCVGLNYAAHAAES